MDLLEGLKNLNPIPFIKQDINNRFVRTSSRELSQDILTRSMTKPVFMDNWDIIIEFDITSTLDMVWNLLKNLGLGVAGLATAAGAGITQVFSRKTAGPTNIYSANEALSRLGTGQALETLPEMLKNAINLVDLLNNRTAILKLSVRTEQVTLPTYEVITDHLRFGPLRYHYAVDYDFKGFSMRIREDEDNPIYPLFESLRKIQFNPDGTLNEPSKSRFTMYMTLFSDYTGMPFITYNLIGARLKSIKFGEGNVFSRDTDGGNVNILKYNVDFDVDDFSVAFNAMNPLVSIGSNVLDINKLFKTVGQGNFFAGAFG